VSCLGHALAPEKGPPVPIVTEAGWASELVRTQRLEDKSFATPEDRTPVVQSVRHYTSCASPAPIKWKAKLIFEVAKILLDIPQKTHPKLRIFVRFITMTSEIRNNHYNGITEHTKLKTKSVMTSSSTIFFFFYYGTTAHI
jgi:hypothetical protein